MVLSHARESKICHDLEYMFKQVSHIYTHTHILVYVNDKGKILLSRQGIGTVSGNAI